MALDQLWPTVTHLVGPGQLLAWHGMVEARASARHQIVTAADKRRGLSTLSTAHNHPRASTSSPRKSNRAAPEQKTLQTLTAKLTDRYHLITGVQERRRGLLPGLQHRNLRYFLPQLPLCKTHLFLQATGSLANSLSTPPFSVLSGTTITRFLENFKHGNYSPLRVLGRCHGTAGQI